MSFNTKETKVVRKFIKQTIDGDLKWKSVKKKTVIEKELIGNVYELKYENNYFVLYKFKDSYYHPEFDELMSTDEIKLEIYDLDRNLMWEFPKGRELSDLYEAVRKNAEGIDDLLDNILGDDKDSFNDEDII